MIKRKSSLNKDLVNQYLMTNLFSSEANRINTTKIN